MPRLLVILLTLVLFTMLLVNPVMAAEDAEETNVHMVLGGIPLCGDPLIARNYLVSLIPASEREAFYKQWRSRSDGPSGTTEIKIANPVVPLKIGEHERNPSTLFVYIKGEKIHAVEARWAPRSGWGNFKRMISELEMKVRASLGEPDSVTATAPEKGMFGSSGKSEVETIWTEDGRIVRVFSRLGTWKNYIAIDVTCTANLVQQDVF